MYFWSIGPCSTLNFNFNDAFIIYNVHINVMAREHIQHTYTYMNNNITQWMYHTIDKPFWVCSWLLASHWSEGQSQWWWPTHCDKASSTPDDTQGYNQTEITIFKKPQSFTTERALYLLLHMRYTYDPILINISYIHVHVYVHVHVHIHVHLYMYM